MLFSSCYGMDTVLGAEDTKILKMKALLSSYILTHEEMEGELTVVAERTSSEQKCFYILI